MPYGEGMQFTSRILETPPLKVLEPRDWGPGVLHFIYASGVQTSRTYSCAADVWIFRPDGRKESLHYIYIHIYTCSILVLGSSLCARSLCILDCTSARKFCYCLGSFLDHAPRLF